MLGFTIVNDTTDPSVTPDVVAGMSVALSRYVALVCDAWQRLPLQVGTAESDGGIPAGFVGTKLVDALDDPDALAYHTVGIDGRPLILVGWGIIKANGGTFFGADGMTSTTGHELAETAIDPELGLWWDLPDGSAETPLEVCDPLQGEDFEQDEGSGLFVPNFCLPRYYSSSPGRYDFRGNVSQPGQVNRGGYQVRRVGGPRGHSSDVFGAEAHLGGMPTWKRLAKACAGSRRSRRHGA